MTRLVAFDDMPSRVPFVLRVAPLAELRDLVLIAGSCGRI